jgi:AraC-like DNA-binding protein
MTTTPAVERRKHREALTKQAMADTLRLRIFNRRVQQTNIARWSGISRSHLRALLRAEKQMSLFIFLELSKALGFDDPAQFLHEVLRRREQLLAESPTDGPA